MAKTFLNSMSIQTGNFCRLFKQEIAPLAGIKTTISFYSLGVDALHFFGINSIEYFVNRPTMDISGYRFVSNLIYRLSSAVIPFKCFLVSTRKLLHDSTWSHRIEEDGEYWEGIRPHSDLGFIFELGGTLFYAIPTQQGCYACMLVKFSYSYSFYEDILWERDLVQVLHLGDLNHTFSSN